MAYSMSGLLLLIDVRLVSYMGIIVSDYANIYSD